MMGLSSSSPQYVVQDAHERRTKRKETGVCIPLLCTNLPLEATQGALMFLVVVLVMFQCGCSRIQTDAFPATAALIADQPPVASNFTSVTLAPIVATTPTVTPARAETFEREPTADATDEKAEETKIMKK